MNKKIIQLYFLTTVLMRLSLGYPVYRLNVENLCCVDLRDKTINKIRNDHESGKYIYFRLEGEE